MTKQDVRMRSIKRNRGQVRRRCMILGLAILPMAAHQLVAAGPKYYVGTATGNWNSTSDWSSTPLPGTPGAPIPVAGDSVFIINSDNVNRNITYDYTGPAITLTTLQLSLSNANTSTSNLTTLMMTANALSSTDERFGNSGGGANGGGAMNQSGGINTVGAGGLYMGYNATDKGIYNLSGGTLNANGNVYIGYSGTGTFKQTGGNNSINGASNLNIGALAGSTGSYLISNSGTLNVAAGTINVGALGSGVLNQSGGTVIGSILSVAGAGGITSTVNLTGGSMNVSGSESVGNVGNGVLTHSAGTNTVGFLDLGSNPGASGAYSLSGSAVLSAGNEDIGDVATGSFNQSGGTNSISGDFIMAEAPGVNSTYILSGNGVFNDTGGEFLGFGGNATFNQTGGTHTLNNSFLLIGNVGGTGTYLLSGNGVLSAEGDEFVGKGGTGVFNQTGGVHSLTGLSDLVIGSSSSTSGTYLLSAGSLSVNGTEIIASLGIGAMIQSGGANSVVGELDIGDATSHTGTYTQTGGTASITGDAYIGGDAGGIEGIGVLAISGTSSFAVSGTLNVFASPGNVINLSGGTLSVGAMNISSPSYFNWTAGTLNFTNGLTLDPTGTDNAFGGSLALGSAQTLNVNGNESIGGAGGFNLTLNTGSSHTVSGTITLPSSGSLTLSGGTLSYAVFNQTGGTVIGNLTNAGIFNYQSGSFLGRLTNLGTVTFGTTFAPGNGLENDSTLTVSAGQFLNTGVTGLDNFGNFTLTGGTIGAASPTIGQVINDYGGNMAAAGTISSATFANYGTVTVTGLLTASNLFTNYGVLTINAGALVKDTFASPVENASTITLNGGGMLAALTNDAGATLQGSGSISGQLINNGTVLLSSGNTMNITRAWTNAGLLNLQGITANLVGGAITNTSIIQGYGQIGAVVQNSVGVIRGQNGELDLTAVGDTNSTTATIEAGTGGTVMFTKGLAANAGIIAISGGTFDNSNQPLTNSNMIEGTGTFRAGSWTNSTGAQINLTAGANVFGNLSNAGAMHLYGSGITFYGNVTNTGTVKVTAGSVYFLGSSGATIGGSYASDPSDNYFNSLTITSTGSVTGGTGDRFFLVNGTSFNNAGNFNDLGTLSANVVNNTGTFVQTGTLIESANFTNSGTATIGGSQNWSHGTVFTNTAATATFQTDAGSTAENLTVTIPGGSVAFSSTQHLASLNIGSGNSAIVTGGGAGHRSVLFTPSLSVVGTLDLTNNDLDLQVGGSTGLSAISSLIQAGYNNGTWTGIGITSSAAGADTTHLTALGVLLNTAYTSLDGSPVAIGDVLAKYTYYGDANLDGLVSSTDYTLIDAGYLSHGAKTGWFNGDFNYDGVINGSDYTLIDNAFNTQGAVIADQLASPTAQVSGATITAVPEPASLALAIAGASLLVRRVRRAHACGETQSS